MTNPDQSRNELQDILSQKEYRVYYEDHRNFLEVWWDRATSWIGEQLSNWFSSFEPSSGLAEAIVIVGIVVVLALIVLTLLLAVRTVRRKRRFRDHQPLQYMDEKQWSYHNHLSEAQEQESEENYSLAARHMFLALLLYFHKNGWLEAKSWKTNWDYFDELRKVNQTRAEKFYHLALLFDEVFYGERVMQKDEYIQYRDEAMKWLNEDTVQKSI